MKSLWRNSANTPVKNLLLFFLSLSAASAFAVDRPLPVYELDITWKSVDFGQLKEESSAWFAGGPEVSAFLAVCPLSQLGEKKEAESLHACKRVRAYFGSGPGWGFVVQSCTSKDLCARGSASMTASVSLVEFYETALLSGIAPEDAVLVLSFSETSNDGFEPQKYLDHSVVQPLLIPTEQKFAKKLVLTDAGTRASAEFEVLATVLPADDYRFKELYPPKELFAPRVLRNFLRKPADAPLSVLDHLVAANMYYNDPEHPLWKKKSGIYQHLVPGKSEFDDLWEDTQYTRESAEVAFEIYVQQFVEVRSRVRDRIQQDTRLLDEYRNAAKEARIRDVGRIVDGVFYGGIFAAGALDQLATHINRKIR